MIWIASFFFLLKFNILTQHRFFCNYMVHWIWIYWQQFWLLYIFFVACEVGQWEIVQIQKINIQRIGFTKCICVDFRFRMLLKKIFTIENNIITTGVKEIIGFGRHSVVLYHKLLFPLLMQLFSYAITVRTYATCIAKWCAIIYIIMHSFK